MGSTVDNITNNISIQFDAIDQLIATYTKYDLDLNDVKIIDRMIIDFTDVKEMYFSSTVNILREYYISLDDNNKKLHHNQFIKAFHSCNTIGKLKRFYLSFQKFRKIYDISDPLISDNIKRFESISIDETFINDTSDVCEHCHTPYDIEEKTAEFTCNNCGHIEKMYGVVFEDEQFYYQEGQRTKHGKYDPIKHAKFWLDRIQAKENTEIPDIVLNSVKRCILRDQLWVHNIDCETVRKYLKQTKLTHYNNHVALIRKIITGIEPEQLTEYEVRLIYLYFSNVIQIFNRTKTDEKSNCPYHPFFIYKIIEQILNKSVSTRRKNILSCIHLQSRETLIENDKVWFDICDQMPNFNKIATDSVSR